MVLAQPYGELLACHLARHNGEHDALLLVDVVSIS